MLKKHVLNKKCTKYSAKCTKYSTHCTKQMIQIVKKMRWHHNKYLKLLGAQSAKNHTTESPHECKMHGKGQATHTLPKYLLTPKLPHEHKGLSRGRAAHTSPNISSNSKITTWTQRSRQGSNNSHFTKISSNSKMPTERTELGKERAAHISPKYLLTPNAHLLHSLEKWWRAIDCLGKESTKGCQAASQPLHLINRPRKLHI